MTVSFVCWKWTDPRCVGTPRQFKSHHVNVLSRAIKRHYPRPHRFICITNEPEGLLKDVEHMPMPETGFEHLKNPSEQHSQKPFPSCYRRLWNFSEEAKILGERIFALDIDVIIKGDLRSLVDRTASFVGWSDKKFGWQKVAGGAYLLKTGTHTDVWTDFDPNSSPGIARAAGCGGSDQAWMSYKLWPPEDSWSMADGLFKLKWLNGVVPAEAKMIFTSGDKPPWDRTVQRKHPWIQEYWC